MNAVGISDIKKIIQLVHQKYGYDFSNYAVSSFTRRIERILEVYKISFEELIHRIHEGVFSREDFLQEITVNVTEMFRDPGFWKIVKQAIEEIVRKRSKVRIWHAGCASGEEVYSMLILLKEMNILGHAEIFASDIDKSILEKAKKGKISKKFFEVNTHNYQRFCGSKSLEKYFSEDKYFYYFDHVLLDRVQFKEIDLVKQTPFSKYDLVLCRNVLIYFNPYLQNEVLSLLSESLFSGGYLAIGSKEAITSCNAASQFGVLSQEEKIFIKLNHQL